MTFRRAVLFGLMWALAAPGASAALAQDDLLAPLTPAPEKEPKRPPPDDSLLAPLAPTQLVVTLETPVKGARLVIDGKSSVALPVPAPIALPPGEHQLEIRRLGFADYRRTIDLPEAETTTVSIALEPVAAVVNLFVDVPGAQISLDGEGLGAAPLKDRIVAPGKHELLVTRSGFESESSELELEAGRDYTLNIYLRPSADRPERAVDLSPEFGAEETEAPFEPVAQVSSGPDWYERWYVWTGVGAVVVAGVVGAVVVSQNAGALPPETVCGGPCGAVINAPGIVRF